MKKHLSLSLMAAAICAGTSIANAQTALFQPDNQFLTIAAADNAEVPEGFHRMPDGSLMPNLTGKAATIDDFGGNLPPDYHIMSDGTVMANNPATATAPKGYMLQEDGTLVLIPSNNHSATIDDFSGMIPPNFHMLSDGTLKTNDPVRSKAPKGYHIMPDGTLMAQSTDGNAHMHHGAGGHHGKGMMMFEYKYMRMNMDGLKDANLRVDPATILYPEYNFDAAPTKMTMDMHMFMGMYGLTDKITLMAMLHYLANDMTMLIDDQTNDYTSMQSSGIGDTLVSASVKIPHNMTFGFGLSLPTGSVTEKGTMRMRMQDNMPMTMNMLYPYAMQLGSGTIDIIPSLSYRTSWNMFNFGGKLAYTMRTKKTDVEYPYRLGNKLEVSTFAEWNFNRSLEWSAQLTLHSWGKIDGETNPGLLHGPNGTGSPTAHPELYGGTRLDASLGAKVKTKDQKYYVKPEFGIPVYQNLWGPQMRTSWIFSLALGAMF